MIWHISVYNSTGCHHALITNSYSRQYNRSCTYPTVIAYFHVLVDWRID